MPRPKPISPLAADIMAYLAVNGDQSARELATALGKPLKTIQAALKVLSSMPADFVSPLTQPTRLRDPIVYAPTWELWKGYPVDGVAYFFEILANEPQTFEALSAGRSKKWPKEKVRTRLRYLKDWGLVAVKDGVWHLPLYPKGIRKEEDQAASAGI